MGAVKEMIFYLSDQSDSRTAIEANIGETYSIDLPSGVDTGYDEVDGFVETWYDQSSSAVTNYDLYPTIASGSFSSTGVTFQKLPLGNADERTFTLVANNSTATRYVSFVTGSNGIRTGKHRIAFDLTLNSGSIGTITGYHTDRDADPSNGGSYAPYVVTEGSNVIDFEIFNDGVGASPEIIWAINTGSTFDISVTNFEVSHVTETIVRNGNDATQLTASRQPKIVDAGVLVLRNGNAAIKSTSDDSMNFTLDSLSADGQQSVFSVLENDVTSQDNFGQIFRVSSTSTRVGGDNRRPWQYVTPTGGITFSVDSLSGYQNTDREYRLYSHIMNDDAGGTSTIYKDGTQVDTRSITLDANANFYSAQMANVTANATGALYMSEVIYYPSDQSANRAGIEANIILQYDI
jgi:hypothetical protein